MTVSIKLHRHFVPLLLVLGVQQLRAASITLDLGLSRIATNQIDTIAFTGLNGTPVSGLLSVDFIFSNSTFVRLFNQYSIPSFPGPPTLIGTSPAFGIGLSLQTSGSGLVGFLRGTGHITDGSGNPIPGYGVTGSTSSDKGEMSIALFPLERDETGAPNSALLRPLDFYGVHFDVLLPDDPSLQVTGAGFGLFDSGEFGIGPNVPMDIPEPSAFALAALGGLAFLPFRHRCFRQPATI